MFTFILRLFTNPMKIMAKRWFNLVDGYKLNYSSGLDQFYFLTDKDFDANTIEELVKSLPKGFTKVRTYYKHYNSHRVGIECWYLGQHLWFVIRQNKHQDNLIIYTIEYQ